jgi:hypothetical protein
MLRTAFLALALAACFAPWAQAQYSALAEFYGRGVHAYYSGDYVTAYDYLSKAIDGGIKDPRAYYFRGLTASASGREYEAEGDYRAGAELEAPGAFGPAISQSLTRVQGSCRMAIEQARQQARLDYQASAVARSRARYGDIDAAGDDVLRDRPAPQQPIAPPGTRPAPPPVPTPAANPFENDGAAGQPKVDSRDLPEAAVTDPFADDAAPAMPDGAPPAAGDDPFGAPAPAAGDDPFGAPAPGMGADPFGGGAGNDPFAN